MKFIISISRSISFTPQETDSDTFPSKLIPIWIITEQVAVKKIISTMLLPPLLHQSIRLKFQFRQSRYSETLLGQVLFNSSYFCSRVIRPQLRNTKGKRAWRPEKTSEKFPFFDLDSESFLGLWKWLTAFQRGRKEEGGRKGLLVAQTFTSFLAGYRLFAFLFPAPPPVNFQTFFGERIILCFLERNALVLFDWTMLDKEGNFLLASRGILYF